MMKRLLIAILIILFSTTAAFGTDYYVNCDAVSDGNGSIGSPWNSIAAAKNFQSALPLSTGDDVYFKKDVKCTLTSDSDRIDIEWAGTSENHVEIGCYNSAANDCSAVKWIDGDRAILSGDSDADNIGNWPSASGGIIRIPDETGQYIDVKDIRLEYSGFAGFTAKEADYITAENLYIYRPYNVCIIYAAKYADNDGVTYSSILDNWCENAQHPNYSVYGAVIEVTGQGRDGVTHDILVSGNYVTDGQNEGIGFYRGVTNSIAEYNVIRDMNSFHMYIDNSSLNTFRYNLIYDSTDDDHGGGDSEWGIAIDTESNRIANYSHDNKVYGNMIAGMNKGINLMCEIEECTAVDTPHAGCTGDWQAENCQTGTLIYNNTLVDNNTSIVFWGGVKAADSILVKNNISHHTANTGQVHMDVGDEDAAGVTYATNLFSSTDDVLSSGSNADDSNVSTSDPGLARTSSFYYQVPGTFDQSDFKLSSGSSVAVDAGTTLGADYDEDYWGTERVDGYFDIGAHEYEGIAAPPVDYGKTKILRGTLK